MRRINLALGVSAAVLTAFLPAGSEAACAKCAGSGGMYAGACGAPGYGSMSPGCCEHVPSCCDHIWDGYCQERHCGWGLRLCWPARWWPAGPTCETPTAAPTKAPVPAPATAPIPAPAAPIPGAKDTPQMTEPMPPKEEKEAKC